jgi:replicative DNA helicase
MVYREGNDNEDCDDPTLTDFYLRKNRNGPSCLAHRATFAACCSVIRFEQIATAGTPK